MKINLKKNVPLRNYTTFKIGGKARYFFVAKKKEDVKNAIEFAKKKRIPFFILGEGSNVLFPDEGFRGIVIKLEILNFKLENNKVFVGAGYPLTKLAQKLAKKSFSGLEFAVGIPGTIGGAIRGNAGAFGMEIKDVVDEVEVLKIENCKLKIEKLKNKDCQFGYRESIFKKKKNWIILKATLKIKKGNKKRIQEKIKKILSKRIKTQPLEFPSAGSVFKNIPLEKVPKNVKEKFRDKIKREPFPCLPAAVLIEALGLKGYQIGGAKISEKHANFIINAKKAKAKDILQLIRLIKKKVRKRFGVNLELEIELVKV